MMLSSRSLQVAARREVRLLCNSESSSRYSAIPKNHPIIIPVIIGGIFLKKIESEGRQPAAKPKRLALKPGFMVQLG